MRSTDIILERETANDEFALVVRVLAEPGKSVDKDELIFEIENSKAVQELRAPEAGILSHELEVGKQVDFGVPIAQILSRRAWERIVARRYAEPKVEAVNAPVTAVASLPPAPQIATEVVASSVPATEIVLERETANDESATVVGLPVASGTAVKKDQLIFEIENSKAVQELYAPEDGVLIHQLDLRQTVEFGVPIAKIVSAAEWGRVSSPAASTASVMARVVEPSPSRNGTGSTHNGSKATSSSAPTPNKRFSAAAQALLKQHGLNSEIFTTSFVTSRDVRAHLEPAKEVTLNAPAPQQQAPSKPLPGAGPGKEVGRSKRVEIDVLSKGAGATMLSVLGIGLGPMIIAREPGSFLEGRITDLVIFEASRLMKKYPLLNAYYADGQIYLHEAVHAGMAIDSGHRLVVYGIEKADQASLHELAATMEGAIERYLEDALTGGEMSRATFMVTDLSGDELDFVLPLLPRGQSCIIGVTRSEQAGFRLFAGFDHRVTEGREVGLFLGELKQRLLSFASSHPPETPESRCTYCERTAAESVTKGKDKGLLKTVDRNGQEVLCCGSCWNGW
jgi:pyruvate/2-oxoglutarate dehydrogenase complex dihydrolipoamide acyltransferase (E2) component